MLGEGDVTALPLFRRELRILLSSIFGEKNPFGFAIFSWTDVEALFLVSRDVTLFLGRTYVIQAVFCRQLRSGRCKAQILISSTYLYAHRQERRH
jgi:hypothetical protein